MHVVLSVGHLFLTIDNAHGHWLIDLMHNSQIMGFTYAPFILVSNKVMGNQTAPAGLGVLTIVWMASIQDSRMGTIG